MEEQKPEIEFIIDEIEIPDEYKHIFESERIETEKEISILEEKLHLELKKLNFKHLKEEKNLWGGNFKKYEDLKKSIFEKGLKIQDQFSDTPEGKKIQKEFLHESANEIRRLMERVGVDQKDYNKIQEEHMCDLQFSIEKLRGSLGTPQDKRKKATVLNFIAAKTPPDIIAIPPYPIFDATIPIKIHGDNVDDRSVAKAHDYDGYMQSECILNVTNDISLDPPILTESECKSTLGIFHKMHKKGKLEVIFFLENLNLDNIKWEADLRNMSDFGIPLYPGDSNLKSQITMQIISKNKLQDENIKQLTLDKDIKGSDFSGTATFSSYKNSGSTIVKNGSIWRLRFITNNIYELEEELSISLTIDNSIKSDSVRGYLSLSDEWRLTAIGLRAI